MTILLVLLFSAAFIAAEADHDCAGENCPICAQIAVCQNILKTFSLAVCIAAFPAVFSYTLCRGEFCLCRCHSKEYFGFPQGEINKLKMRTFYKGEVYLFPDRLFRRWPRPCIFCAYFSVLRSFGGNKDDEKMIALALCAFDGSRHACRSRKAE